MLSSRDAGRCEKDFKAFLYIVWKRLQLPPPTPRQYELADYLQYGPHHPLSPTEREALGLPVYGKRRVLEAFRGIGKSWITAAYIVWRAWVEHRLTGPVNSRYLVVSASKDRSDAFSTFTKRLLVEIDFLNHLTPDARKGDRDSNVQFDFRGAPPAHAPSVKSVGVLGQMTGSRADTIVGDDIEVPNNSETATQREKLAKRWTEAGGAVLSPGGEVILLGTAQTEETIYNKLATDHGYEMCVWPARVPRHEKLDSYGGRLVASIQALVREDNLHAGSPTDPERFDEMELAERELEYGASGFALQFMLDTSLSDEARYPLKCRDFIVMDVDNNVAPDRVVWGSSQDQRFEALGNPGLAGDCFHMPMFRSDKFSPYTECAMYIDPKGRGRDEVGYAIGKHLNGLIFVPEWGGLAGGYDEPTLVKLATMARDRQVNMIMVEDNFGDGMWTELFGPVLRRIYKTDSGGRGCALENEKVSGQKEVRVIERLEPGLANHRIVLDTELVRRELQAKRGLGAAEAVLKSNFYQLTRITKDRGALKHEDRVEALAGLINYFQQSMGIDSRHAAEQREAERKAERLRKFMERASKGRYGRRALAWGDKL